MTIDLNAPWAGALLRHVSDPLHGAAME
ncbi:MAG: hypothetical protein QG656_1015, partial [Candidatus Hydrogenedentes bacterium]|nr:hypothetical protein [Candidatus Hydrogenedentota bacterium]